MIDSSQFANNINRNMSYFSNDPATTANALVSPGQISQSNVGSYQDNNKIYQTSNRE